MPTRTRSRGSIASFTQTGSTIVYSCSGTYPAADNYSTQYPSLLESITDVVGGRRSNYRKVVNRCEHTKLEGWHAPMVSFEYAPGGSCWAGGPQDTRTIYTPGWYVAPIMPEVPLPSGWDSHGLWCDKTIRSLTESIPTKMSLPNFLLELDDVRQLPKQIATIGSRISRSLGMSARRRSLSHLPLRSLADAHLAIQFGLKPLISDMKALINAYKTVERRLAWLRKNNRRFVTVRRRQRAEVDIPLSTVSYCGPNGLVSFFYCALQPTKGLYTRSLTARAYIEYADLNKPLAEMAALRSYYGFDKPVSVIWEAIPFSWVIDYFLKVQDVIDRIPTVGPFPGATYLDNLCFSVKTEVKDFRCTYHGIDSRCTPSPSVFFRGKRTTYSRKAGSSVPSANGMSSLYNTHLSDSQVGNILAVLLQKGL